MTTPARFSPSQFKKAQRCERRWYLEKVEGFPDPAGAGAHFGKWVHAILEKYQKEGGPIEKTAGGRVAEPVVPLLPARDSVVLIEEERTFILPQSGAGVLCRIDFATRNPAGHVEPWDFKTTSSPKYAQTPETLATDLQMACYAHALSPAADVRVRHLVTLTRGKPRAWEVSAPSWLDSRAEIIHSLDVLAERLIELRTDGRRDAARKNTSACNDYGGCPHRGRCFGSGSEPGKGNRMATMLEKMRAMKEAAAAGKDPTAGTHIPAPTPAVPAPTPEKTQSEYRDAEFESAATEAPQAPPPPVSITPPDMPGPDAPPLEPRKRGRPAGSKNKPKAGELDFPGPSLAPAAVESITTGGVPPAGATSTPDPDLTAAAFSTPAPPPPVGITLLVDCLAARGMVAQDLGPYVAAACLEVAGAAEVADYRLIDYGRGAGFLAAVIRAAPPAPGIYSISSRGPAAGVALEVLEALADVVIRGVR